MYTKVPLFGLHNEVGIIYSVLIDKILLCGPLPRLAKTNHFHQRLNHQEEKDGSQSETSFADYHLNPLWSYERH
jgi:hypothetical protein